MKKLFLICAITIATMSFSSCGVTRDNRRVHGISETNVVLSQKNFHVVGQVYGQSRAVYICGLGGIRKPALRANAVDEMSRNARLTGSQALANVNVHMSYKMITPLYIEYICDATANVIEFDK